MAKNSVQGNVRQRLRLARITRDGLMESRYREIGQGAAVPYLDGERRYWKEMGEPAPDVEVPHICTHIMCTVFQSGLTLPLT